ncbi:protein of unknown function [Quadrisphaera granulorum]|uniref:Uncharacterized protein DUF4349 n=1 Tax=Quadrisphaera granulorum TaxID=317664 RepID=A0A316B180_9ACTN|nr:DUF4349 domain-containing protein [Quadrisphaera granulorum]PWJ56267.1 uncharacterized protein DUF4349 [Quadrisphaera granulorum]SZE94901.1 protein of unknown function [Quadrisphaera granulorum]
MTRLSKRSTPLTGAVALGAAALIALSGCTSSESGSSATSDAGSGRAGNSALSGTAAEPASAPDAATSGMANSAAESFQSSAAGSSGLVADEARQIITTATASIVVADVAGTAGQVAVLVEGAGGRVEQRSVQTPEEGPASATLVLRIPAERLSTTVDGLSRFGTVSDVNVTATDVTAQATDLDARIAALRTSTDRLTQLLAQANSTEAVVAAEGALTQRQAELDSLTQQRALLAGQVQLATLTLSVNGRAAAPEAGPNDFLDGLASGWRSLVSALGTALVVAGVLLPWLVTAGVVVAVVIAVSRLVQRVQARRSEADRQEVAGTEEPS